MSAIDDDLVDRLLAAVDAVNPLDPRMVGVAESAFEARDLDSELAALLSADALAPSRGNTGDRSETFETDALRIDVDAMSDPPMILVRTKPDVGAKAWIESPGEVRAVIDLDRGSGRFEDFSGPVRIGIELQDGRRVVTDWFAV